MKFIATEKILEPYKKYSEKRRRVFSELQFVEKCLDSMDRLYKPNEMLQYPGITEQTLDKAYHEYKNMVRKKK